MKRPDEFRTLPPDIRLGAVRLGVANLTRSLSFYRDLLGLAVLSQTEGTAALGGVGNERSLVELQEDRGIAPLPAGGRPGLYHFALLLPSRTHLGHFVRHIAEQGVPLGAADHAVSEAVYLQDPDGLGIEVYADRPADRWEYHRGQLRMGTRPLDLERLVADAGMGEWEGFPRDTRMGHLHLHVSDLDRASKFYEGVLGLTRTVWNYPGALFLAAGGYHHHLGLNTWATRKDPAPEPEARLIRWEILLSSREALEAVRLRFEGAGHPVESAQGTLTVRDPSESELAIGLEARGAADPPTPSTH